MRQRVTWSWQQRRLLLRDHCIFLSPRLFFFLYCQCYWPLAGIWIFKRHFISLSCSYSQGKGGKSCTVFLFSPPEFGPADELGSSFYISPLCLLLLSHVPVLFYAWSRLKSRNSQPKVSRIFSVGSCRHLWLIRSYRKTSIISNVWVQTAPVKPTVLTVIIPMLLFLFNSRCCFTSTPSHYAWQHLHCNLTSLLAWWNYS